MCFLQESLRVQQSRARVNAQKEEVRQTQLRESLEARGINSIKHIYQQKQLEEIKRKQAYVLSSPTCVSSTPTPCSSVWAFSLAVCWRIHGCHFSIMRCCWFALSQGIRGEAEVKESGDCGKDPSGGAAGKEQKETAGTGAQTLHLSQGPITGEGKWEAPPLPGSQTPISPRRASAKREWFATSQTTSVETTTTRWVCSFFFSSWSGSVTSAAHRRPPLMLRTWREPCPRRRSTRGSLTAWLSPSSLGCGSRTRRCIKTSHGQPKPNPCRLSSANTHNAGPIHSRHIYCFSSHIIVKVLIMSFGNSLLENQIKNCSRPCDRYFIIIIICGGLSSVLSARFYSNCAFIGG